MPTCDFMMVPASYVGTGWMGRDGAKRRETLPNYNEARSAISNNVRKSAQGIVATRNHMSVNAQRATAMPETIELNRARRDELGGIVVGRLRRDRATYFARAARAAERSLRSRATRD